MILTSTNVPTPIAQHLPLLLQGLRAHALGQELPGDLGATQLATGDVRLSTPTQSGALTLPKEMLSRLSKQSPQALSAMMATALRVTLALFRLGIEDERAGRAQHPGELLACWVSEASGPSMTRLAQAAGLNPRAEKPRARIKAALELLTNMTWCFQVSGKQIKGRLCTVHRREVETRHAPCGHRAGEWLTLSIARDFYEHTHHHFIQCPHAILELSDKALTVALVALTQRHLKARDKTLPNVVSLSLSFLMRAAGLTQTTTRGEGRERGHLLGALGALVKSGIFASHALLCLLKGKRGERVEIEFEASDHPLQQMPPERSPLAAPPPPSDHPLQQALSKTLENQELTSQEQSLVRAFVREACRALPLFQGGKPTREGWIAMPG